MAATQLLGIRCQGDLYAVTVVSMIEVTKYVSHVVDVLIALGFIAAFVPGQVE